MVHHDTHFDTNFDTLTAWSILQVMHYTSYWVTDPSDATAPCHSRQLAILHKRYNQIVSGPFQCKETSPFHALPNNALDKFLTNVLRNCSAESMPLTSPCPRHLPWPLLLPPPFKRKNMFGSSIPLLLLFRLIVLKECLIDLMFPRHMSSLRRSRE